MQGQKNVLSVPIMPPQSQTQPNNAVLAKNPEYLQAISTGAITMTLKILIYSAIRYCYMFLHDKDSSAVLFSKELQFVSVILFSVYIALTFALYKNFAGLKKQLKGAFFISVCLLEVAFLLNAIFSAILLASVICLALFYICLFVLAKCSGSFEPRIAFLLVTAIFLGGIAFQFLLAGDYIVSADYSYLAFNAFTGAFYFCLWSILYFGEPKNFEIAGPVWISTVFMLDAYGVIGAVWQQVKAEFRTLEMEEKQSDLIIDQPRA